MDVVAPKRDRARERLCELDLVMLAVMINVNDGPFTAFGQDTALALDGMPESHHGEFRNLECIAVVTAAEAQEMIDLAMRFVDRMAEIVG